MQYIIQIKLDTYKLATVDMPVAFAMLMIVAAWTESATRRSKYYSTSTTNESCATTVLKKT